MSVCLSVNSKLEFYLCVLDNLKKNKNTPEYLWQIPSQWWMTQTLAVTRIDWPPMKMKICIDCPHPMKMCVKSHFQDYLPLIFALC